MDKIKTACEELGLRFVKEQKVGETSYLLFDTGNQKSDLVIITVKGDNWEAWGRNTALKAALLSQMEVKQA